MSNAKARGLRYAARYGLPVLFVVALGMSVSSVWWSGEEAAEAVPSTKRATPPPPQNDQLDLPVESGNDLKNHALALSQASPLKGAEQQNTPPLTKAEVPRPAQLSALPAESLELVKIAVAQTVAKNYTSAALALLDAIELSSNNPETHEYMHQLAGWNYEQAGLVDFAIEQYQLAIAINPVQRSSYEGLRRLDPEFRASHEPLPDPLPAKASATGDKLTPTSPD